jgi:molybdate transport system substrate-binding protein
VWDAVRFLLGVMLMVLAGCSRGGDDDQVVVFAAASLNDAFGALAEGFEAAHSGTDVVVNAAASSELATQIVEGAPADVFASADLENMNRIVDAAAVDGAPRVFVVNRPEIMVEHGNPLGIESVADLADPDLVVVVCAPEVPCGHYAAETFVNAGVDVVPDSYEVNVRSVVTKIVAGEADAGIVYATDVQAAGDAADGVAVPNDVGVVAEYSIAVLADAPNPTMAHEFVAYVDDDRGRSILESYGFETR